MSTKFLLQFGKLEEFIQEDIHQGNVVRVVALGIEKTITACTNGSEGA